MNKKQEIRSLLNLAAKLHFDEVVDRAKAIMNTHRNIETFCMGMGTATFHLFNGRHLDGEKYVQPFYDFLHEFNSELHTTGDPIKIDRIGNELVVKTDW